MENSLTITRHWLVKTDYIIPVQDFRDNDFIVAVFYTSV